MVLGENGLINKAQSSVDKYQQSANNEQELLNSIEQYIDLKGQGATELTLSETSGTCIYPNTLSFTVTNNPSGGTISATSSDELVATVSVSGNNITITPKNVTETVTVTVKSAAIGDYEEKTATYTVKVYDNTYVTPAQIAAAPTTYYGAKVTNYTAGGATWRIFYVDTEDGADGNGKYGDGKNTVYLIAEYDDNRKQALGTYSNSTFTANVYASSTTKIREMNPTWKEYRQSVAESSWNPNEKAAAYLCDSSKWTTYCDSTKANYAIGSPSLEMYADSYNKTHNSNSLVYTCTPTSGTHPSNSGSGYFVGANGTYSNSGDYTKSKTIDTSQNGIYMVSGQYLWLASPSARDTHSLSYIMSNGANLASNSLEHTEGVRPLVSLKSDFQIKIEV